MNFPAGLFPLPWQLAGAAVLVAAIAWGVRARFWSPLAEQPGRAHVWGGAIVTLALLWTIKAGVQPGLDLHLIGAMAFVLAFGPALGIAGLTVVLAAVTAFGAAAWSNFGLNWVAQVLAPASLASVWFRLVERGLPNHFFVYVFVNAFLGAGIAAMAACAAGSALLWAAGAYPAEHLLAQYLPYGLLLAFSEAWMSGMAVTLMVVFRPGWVSTFDDARYLLNK